mmetsp:Transcript_6469/g.14622  ORF Transcript_6469/g.14622 Transcript_6469/m.14622 type:complete len:89 (+) Transcript_6469:466-732(+)
MTRGNPNGIGIFKPRIRTQSASWNALGRPLSSVKLSPRWWIATWFDMKRSAALQDMGTIVSQIADHAKERELQSTLMESLSTIDQGKT